MTEVATIEVRKDDLSQTREVKMEAGPLAPGAALEALPGVARQQPGGSAAAVLPVLESDEMVFVNHGALLFCPSHWGLREGILPRNDAATSYRMLTVGAASALLEEMQTGEDDAAVA